MAVDAAAARAPAVAALPASGAPHPPVDSRERILRWIYLAACTLIFVFLLAPILVIVPLSFNAEPYFTFTEGMLRLDPDA